MDSTNMINILVSVVWETIIPSRHFFINGNKEKTTEDKVKDIVSFNIPVQNSLAFV